MTTNLVLASAVGIIALLGFAALLVGNYLEAHSYSTDRVGSGGPSRLISAGMALSVVAAIGLIVLIFVIDL